MSDIIAYCGLNCSECPAYLATQSNDPETLEAVAAKWRDEYHSPDITVQSVTCDGCNACGRLAGYCSMCEIRACAEPRGITTCAECQDYGCEKLLKFFEMVPAARVNLETLRSM